MDSPVRIFFLHRHRLFAETLRASLDGSGTESRVEMVGFESGLEGTLDALTAHEIDIVLVERSLDRAPVYPWIRRLREALPEIRVVLVGLESEEDVLECIEAGAHACLLCTASLDDLVSTLRLVGCGQPSWSPEIQNRLHERLVGLLRLDRQRGPAAPRVRLTPREREVLRLLHLRKKELGRQLGIAEPTVKIHVHKILKKLKVSNRREAVRLGRELGLRR